MLAFVDLDHLKRVNDLKGHQEGDDYLRAASRLFRDTLVEKEDYLFRYGGDEFLLLYTDCTRQQGEERLQEVNEKLAEIARPQHFPFTVSISYGIAENGEGKSARELLHLADHRMYEQKAKRGVVR